MGQNNNYIEYYDLSSVILTTAFLYQIKFKERDREIIEDIYNSKNETPKYVRFCTICMPFLTQTFGITSFLTKGSNQKHSYLTNKSFHFIHSICICFLQYSDHFLMDLPIGN